MPTYSTYIDLGDLGEEVPLTLQYDYTPAERGSLYARNGDPGDPPIPASIEVTETIWGRSGLSIDFDQFPERLQDRLTTTILEAEEAAANHYPED